MTDARIHHPNDHLFKAIFACPDNASAFLQNHLPPDLTTVIPCSSVIVESSSFLDPSLSNLHSDVLLRVPLPHSDAFMIVLLEHQSAPDPRLPLRILGYVLRVLERFARETPSSSSLPVVIPVLVSQSDRPWTGPLTLHPLLSVPSAYEEVLRPFLIPIHIHVLDLFTTPYEALRGTPDGILALRALKAKPLGELLSDHVWDSSVLEGVSTDAMTSFLLYTLDAEEDPDAVMQRTELIHSEAMNTAATSAAQKLIQRGISQGISQGIVEGQRQGRYEGKLEGKCEGIRASILQTLELRFGEVPDCILRLIEATTSPDRLMNWLASSVRCPSLQSFQEHLSKTGDH